MINYQAWLETTDIARGLIVQATVNVAGVDQVLYLSTHPATVGGITYSAIIKSSIDINESLSLNYSASISFGDIELVNPNGELDSWLSYIWKNKPVKIYYGKVSTSNQTLLDDYELIFDGVCSDIDSKSRNVLSIKIRDKLEKLNTPVTEALLGNYFQGALVDESVTVNQNRNNIKPKVYGEVNNISPLLTDPTQLEFMVNDGPVEQIIEVLDNGVPVSFITAAPSGTPTIPPGSFRLLAPLAGTCTASVQGIARTVNITGSTYSDAYLNTARNIIALLLKFAGKGIEYTEIDSASFAAFGGEAVGIYLNDRTNVLALCQQIAKSCGLTLAVTRQGKVKLIELSVPTTASVNITNSDVVLNSLRLVNKPEVVAAVKLGFCRNWTVLSGLVTGIPEEHKDLFAKEYLEVLVEDASVKAAYDLDSEPVIENTILVDRAQTTVVANKTLNLFKTSRKVIGMTCTAKFLSLEIGSAVRVFSDRFELSSGSYGIVTATKPNWLSGKIDLEVLI